MKFSWERESDEGFCTIRATPEDYDASPPVQVLSMDYIPRLVTNDRLAVSCLLAFGYYASGAVNLISTVSAEMAEAAVSVLDARVVIPSIDYTPKAITYGNNIFKLSRVTGQNIDLQWNGFDSPREFGLRMVPMSSAYVSSFSEEILTVPTNAGLVVPPSAGADSGILPYIAQAILLAEDMNVGIIKLPAGTTRSTKLNKTARLLQTCGLSLQFTE